MLETKPVHQVIEYEQFLKTIITQRKGEPKFNARGY